MSPIQRLLVAAVAAACLPAIAGGPSFGQVVDNLDLRKNTKLHAREYCKSLHGQEVSWSGTVLDVRGGKNRAKVYVADKSRPLHSGYNIVVETRDLAKASNLKRGQHVRFKGPLDSCTLKSAGAVVSVEEAEID